MNDRKCIMLVEDTASHRKLYASWLRIGGYDPHVLTDERTAQAVAEELNPAAIIVDIRLPNVSGLDVIEGLKTATSTRAIPVMALTVLDSPTDRSACLAAGADVFVTKPDHIATFLDRIAALLD
ncbi:DNA-binding response OmpR family regulator [Sphingomonas sp. BE138]|uniref:response regulator transcription factor n=1 Tax=Sphingomonas sp. BE138 TaxID=2817845 RepID=UPI0028676298|nr:response regulator [Sphingomonas sp. BE138]MDR6786917.1 DNA-binding response OmpR family regulator [Sphingomonas sp. BE138]